MKWTEEDEARAREEGWSYRLGYLNIVFRPDGSRVFDSSSSVMEYLYRQAQNSEWHAEIYAGLPYTFLDNRLAINEGWWVRNGRIARTRAGKIIFNTDKEALEYVVSKAQEGGMLHTKAISFITAAKLGVY